MKLGKKHSKGVRNYAKNFAHLSEEVIKGKIKELVRKQRGGDTNLLEQEASKPTQSGRYECCESRQGYFEWSL